jgi:ElaA protein
VDELYELLRVRSEVFVVEQDCVYQDMDGDDQKAIHLWLTVADKVVALARVCPEGTHMEEVSIGRVITTERNKGYGKQIMLHAIDAAVAHFNAKRIDIEAQEYARGFYESVGFRQSSESFILDGIPHIRMTLTI